MKSLPTLQQLADEIEASINDTHRRVTVASQESARLTASVVEDTMEDLKAKVVQLQALLAQAGRPILDDIGRERCVHRIIEGLKGFNGLEMQARVATSSYNRAWFEAEPDAELRSMLAQKLLKCYAGFPSANVTLWEQYA